MRSNDARINGWILASAALLSLLPAVSLTACAEQVPPIVSTPAGKLHLALSVTTLDGKTFDLAAQRGKWVIVNFWATWCPPCTESMPAISRFAAAHRDVAVIGVSYGDANPQAVINYAKEHLPDYPLAWLSSAQPVPTFGRESLLPATYVIAPDGIAMKVIKGQFDAAQLAQVLRGAGYPSGK